MSCIAGSMTQDTMLSLEVHLFCICKVSSKCHFPCLSYRSIIANPVIQPQRCCVHLFKTGLYQFPYMLLFFSVLLQQCDDLHDLYDAIMLVYSCVQKYMWDQQAINLSQRCFATLKLDIVLFMLLPVCCITVFINSMTELYGLCQSLPVVSGVRLNGRCTCLAKSCDCNEELLLFLVVSFLCTLQYSVAFITLKTVISLLPLESNSNYCQLTVLWHITAHSF